MADGANHMNETPVLLTERSDGVLTLTLNRPAARNALNIALLTALAEQFQQFADDPALRVAIITGSDPAFCAGLDLNDFTAPDSPRHLAVEVIVAAAALRKPIIGAINGAAMTGGMEIALACDFTVASEQARFGDTHSRIGALSGSGMGARLPHAVGPRWAKQISYTAQPIDAATALRIGLVNEVKPHTELLAYVQQLARTIAAHDPQIIGIVKNTIDQGALTTMADGLRIEREALLRHKATAKMEWQR
jgi:enoyl-CoA hydratase